jgi:hypothetical protein
MSDLSDLSDLNDVPDGPPTAREHRADLREERANQREAEMDERANRDDDDRLGRAYDKQDSAVHQVEDLVAANVASNATMLKLVEKVREDSYMREKKIDLLEEGLKQTHRLLAMVGAVLVLMLALGVINAVNIYDARRNAAVTAKTAQDANGTYALLLDCLNSRGECGKLNAENAKKTLDEVKLYELTVLYCVRINPALADPKGDQFIDCVTRLYPGGPILKNR